MKSLISVIIPAYNAESHMASTLDSILAQDYENIEIILVNDASTDDTISSIKNALKNCSRQWELIAHEQNRGVSAARNTGMAAAKGEYILFMDSDDMVETGFISALYEIVSKSDSDIAFCGYRTQDEATGEENIYPAGLEQDKEYAGEELALMRILRRVPIGIWTMLFRRDFLVGEDLKFTEGCTCAEDLEFVVKSLIKSSKVIFSQNCSYIYSIHDSMGSRSSYSTHEQSIRRANDKFLAFIRAIRYIIDNAESKSIVSLAQYMLLPKFHLKMFNVYAWRDDREEFNKSLHSQETRTILWSSRKSFFKEPQLFLKCIWLFAFPNMYYVYRRKHIYFDRI
jgi:glycosyltransferase involved in cell wall biosynthesis